jgi:hypothetical protein
MRRELLLIGIGLALAAAAACKREPSPAADRGAKGGPPLPDPLAGNSFYRLDAGPQTPCTAGATCEARLVLTALAGYHVNREYPVKFIGEPTPGVLVEGTGTFALDDAKTGTLTIRYRADKAGRARIAGTFKLSVCSDAQCEIEQPKIVLELPVG